MDDIRLSFKECRDLLLERIAEKAPSRMQMLCGPRQVGKTTLLLQLVAQIGEAAVYAAADGPEASVPGFWERLWTQAEQTAKKFKRSVLLIDEIHLLPNWDSRLKGEWDRIRRKQIPVQVVVSGSSSLRMSKGSRESLAGRFERITLTHWSASSISQAFKIPQKEAAALIVEQGSYPGAFDLRKDRSRWRAYINDAILEPAIGRDIFAMAEVRRPELLRRVFALSASFPAQIVSLQKLQGQLKDAGSLETISGYLYLLEQAFLVVGLQKYASQPGRRRAAPPKLITLNNALLAVVDPRGIPNPSQDTERFGRWVENACLAHLFNRGQRVTYWREEPYEVDAVIEGSWGKWAIEVKAGGFSSHDLNGLFEFTRRNSDFQPLVVCDDERRKTAERLGVKAVSWQRFLNRAL